MHLDEGTIHAWLDGALDAEEAARVERHAAECGPCAAGIAEARGLVAGASRILTALDAVPGNVVPKTGASVGGSRSRRTRSLWATLHLTPARAAAAAIVVMAAGTALVLRNAPNAARSAIKLADNPNPAATMQPAAPMVVPHVAPDTAASRTFSAPAREAPRASRRAGVGQGGEGRAAAVAVAPKAQPVHADQVALSDSATRERNLDRLVTKKESAAARSAVADNAVRGVVATGAASAAPAAPPSAVAQRLSEVRKSAAARSAAGCYIVTTDSAIALPPRLLLDSSVVPQPAMLRSRAAAADAAAPERRGVSEIANDARRSIAGAYWTPRSDGSIRLLLPASSVNVDLFPASASTLVGAMPLGDRSATVTLRRVECGSR